MDVLFARLSLIKSPKPWLAFILSGLFAKIIGRLNDIYGPRILMIVSEIFLATGVMLMSQLAEKWQLYVFI